MNKNTTAKKPIPPGSAFEIFAQKAPEIRQEILRYFRKDSCIVSSRIAVDLLQSYNIPSFPLVVRTLLYERRLYEAMIAAGHDRYSHAIRDQFLALRDNLPGPTWFIGVGLGDPDKPGYTPGNVIDGLWVGHLVAVAIVSGKMYVIDLSIDQANRAGLDVNFAPIIQEVEPGQLTSGFVIEHGAAVIQYLPNLDECSYIVKGVPGDWERDDDVLQKRIRKEANRMLRAEFEKRQAERRRAAARKRWQDSAARVDENGRVILASEK